MAGWEIMTLRRAGVTLIDCVHATPPAVDSGYPYIGIPQMKDGRLDFDGARRISGADFAKWTVKAKPQMHDIVLSRRTNPGVVAPVRDDTPFALGQNLVLLRASGERVAPAFLRWLASSPFWWDQIAKFINVGAIFDSLRCADVPNFELPVPPMADQEAISELLSALDDKIELNRRMNETLEAQARALFRDWFVDFGPVKAKMAGDTPYLAPDFWSLFPNRLDDDGVPEGWETAMLDAFAISQNRKANPEEVEEGTAYIGLEHMPRRSIALAEWEGAEKVTSAKSRFKRREILFGKLRPYFHKVGIAPIDGICSTDIVVLAPKKQHFEALTLACVSTDEFVAFTDQSSTGTKMPRTSWKIMRTYPMVKPDDAVADAFQQLCEPMIDRILANIAENQSLAQTRDLLLPKLMSGEIRVGDLASEELSAA